MRHTARGSRGGSSNNEIQQCSRSRDMCHGPSVVFIFMCCAGKRAVRFSVDAGGYILTEGVPPLVPTTGVPYHPMAIPSYEALRLVCTSPPAGAGTLATPVEIQRCSCDMILCYRPRVSNIVVFKSFLPIMLKYIFNAGKTQG